MELTQQTRPASRTGTRLRAPGIAGLAATVLLFGGQGFILAKGTAEPGFGASAAEIQRFNETHDTAFYSIGSYLVVLGLVAFLWFICGVHTAVRGHGGEREWLPTVALASGVTAVGATLLDAWQLAVFRVSEGLDPQLGRFAFDMGNLAFASAWVALGSFAIAVGWAALSSRSLPGVAGLVGRGRRNRPGRSPGRVDLASLAPPVRAVLAVGHPGLRPVPVRPMVVPAVTHARSESADARVAAFAVPGLTCGRCCRRAGEGAAWNG